MGMSEQKMRDALEHFVEAMNMAKGWPDTTADRERLGFALVKAEKALAQQPAGVVELTDGECWSLVQRFGFNERRATSRHADVRKGFCLSGAFLHYEVQPYELARFARAVIAAHITKQGGAA